MKEIKKHFEIEFIKSRSPEEINDMFCQLKEKLESKDKEIAELKEIIEFHSQVSQEQLNIDKQEYIENQRLLSEISALKEEVERLKTQLEFERTVDKGMPE